MLSDTADLQVNSKGPRLKRNASSGAPLMMLKANYSAKLSVGSSLRNSANSFI